MTQSRSINSSRNAITSVSARILSLVVNFISRTFFIKYLGEACLGLNGLFTTILSLLSLAELGIGEAIAFYLYKPIAEGDNERLSKLVHFYKICYRIIGAVVMAIGLSLMPLLPYLIKLDSDPGYNIYVLFLLYLLNSSITYFLFSYPQTVLIANQKQYTINIFTIIFQLGIFSADFITLFFTKNFIVYLAVRLSLTCLQNFIIYLYCRKHYPYIAIKPKEKICKDEIKTMFKDVYGVFVLKLSSKLIDSTDNLFISFFLGTILVGYNSNYLMIMTAAISLVNAIIFAFCASVGDYNVNHTKEEVYKLFDTLDYLNFIISFSFAIMIFSFSNHFITILWGENFVFSIIIVAFMSFNFYLVTSIYAVFAFRQALGIFRKSMYFQLFAALLNIALDFALIHALGILGLYIATVTSNLLFAIFPFAKSLYDKEHNNEFLKYFFKTLTRYVYLISFGAATYFACIWIDTSILGFVYRVLITVGIVGAAVLITGIFDKNFKALLVKIKSLFARRTTTEEAV